MTYSAEGDFGRSNSVLPTYVSYSSLNGGLAFERGLEEVSAQTFHTLFFISTDRTVTVRTMSFVRAVPIM